MRLRAVPNKANKANPSFGEFMMLLVTLLHSDGTYQRPISAWRVRDIVFNYIAILFQPLIIGRRGGLLYVIDGQHRLAAAKELGFLEVPCMVYDTVSAAEEAKAFLYLQKYRRQISAPQQFIARIAFKDPTAVVISEHLLKYKFEIGEYDGFKLSSRKNNIILCISAIEHVYDQGGVKLLDDLLYVLRTAWDGRAAALDRRIIRGIAGFMNGNPYSVKSLASKLGDIEPYSLHTAALSISHQYGLTENESMGRVVLNLYQGTRLTARPRA